MELSDVFLVSIIVATIACHFGSKKWENGNRKWTPLSIFYFVVTVSGYLIAIVIIFFTFIVRMS